MRIKSFIQYQEAGCIDRKHFVANEVYLNEAKADIGYHAAPGIIMGSIKKHGLNPKLSKYYSSDEIYFFLNYDEAMWYGQYMANMDEPESFYIIQLDLKGINLKKDYGLTSDGDGTDTAYYTTQKISPDRIKAITKA